MYGRFSVLIEKSAKSAAPSTAAPLTTASPTAAPSATKKVTTPPTPPNEKSASRPISPPTIPWAESPTSPRSPASLSSYRNKVERCAALQAAAAPPSAIRCHFYPTCHGRCDNGYAYCGKCYKTITGKCIRCGGPTRLKAHPAGTLHSVCGGCQS